MNIFLAYFLILCVSQIKLTPFRVESLMLHAPESRVSEYEYKLQKNSFGNSVVRWLFTPEIRYLRSKLDEQNPSYDEGLSLYLSIFSPPRLSILSESYFNMKQSKISRTMLTNSIFIGIIDDLFKYEYLNRKLVYDSLNLEYAKKMMSLAKEKIVLGISDSFDLLQAIDNFENVKLAWLQDSMELIIIKEKIKDRLGLSGDFVVVLDSFIPPQLDSVNPLKSENVYLNEELKKSALSGVYLSLASLLPEVGIKYSWDYFGGRFEHHLNNFDYSKTYRIYLSLNPLDFVFNLRGALLRYKKTSWNFKNTVIQEREKFREYMNNLRFLSGKKEILANRVLLKERSFTLALEKYEQGEVSFQDILKEQADYMSMVAEYLKIRMEIIKLRYSLWYNFGGRR